MTDNMGNIILGVLEAILIGIGIKEAKATWDALHYQQYFLTLKLPKLKESRILKLNPPLKPKSRPLNLMGNPTTCDRAAVPVASVPWECLEKPTMDDCSTGVEVAPGEYWVYQPVIINNAYGKPYIKEWQVYFANLNEPDEPYCSFVYDGPYGEGKIDYTSTQETICLTDYGSTGSNDCGYFN